MNDHHKEAYCLMHYRTDDGEETEVLWNSRDGVTPFVIMSADGQKQMTHVAWERDVRHEWFVPPVGSRIFVDWTDAAARQHYREYVEEHWHAAGYPMSRTFTSKQTAIDSLVASAFQHGTPPTVTIVDDALHEHFKRKAALQ